MKVNKVIDVKRYNFNPEINEIDKFFNFKKNF